MRGGCVVMDVWVYAKEGGLKLELGWDGMGWDKLGEGMGIVFGRIL